MSKNCRTCGEPLDKNGNCAKNGCSQFTAIPGGTEVHTYDHHIINESGAHLIGGDYFRRMPTNHE
jgi:hypothetical protein